MLETAPVDELWFVPAYEHAFGKPLAPFEDRLAMCELAAAALGPRAQVSDVERALGGRSRTLRTVRRLTRAAPRARVFAGHRQPTCWRGGELVSAATSCARTVPFIVVGRARRPSGSTAEDAGQVVMPDGQLDARSRAALAAGEPVEGSCRGRFSTTYVRKGLYRELA